MAKLTEPELYAFFFALHQHENGDRPVGGVDLDTEFERALKQFRNRHDGRPIAPERELTTDRLKKLMVESSSSQDLLTQLLEDGPVAKRPKTAEEIHAEEVAAEERVERLIRKFWISGIAAIIFFMAAISVTIYDQSRPRDLQDQQEAVIRAPQASTFDPVLAAILVLILAASWCGVETWLVAKELWFDADRVKAAVPLIGKRWVESSRRKRQLRSKP